MPRRGTAVATMEGGALAPLPVKRLPDGRYERGASGNPRGIPKGTKQRVPRGMIKRLVFEVLAGNLAAHMNALRAQAVGNRTALQFSEHAARLNQEIGGREDGKGGSVTINFISNVNMLALRAAAPRAAKRELVGAGETRKP